MGQGSRQYNCSPFGTLSANFGATTYQWTSMPDALTSSSTPAQRTAVATLMYHCGVAVNMDYGVGVSLAGSSNVPISMNSFFRFSEGRRLSSTNFSAPE